MNQFCKALTVIHDDPDVSLVAIKIWAYMIMHLKYGEFKTLPQSQICDALYMTQANVSKRIHVLVKKGLILAGPRVGKRPMPTYALPFSIKVII